jgi:hypothetical protein
VEGRKEAGAGEFGVELTALAALCLCLSGNYSKTMDDAVERTDARRSVQHTFYLMNGHY